MMFRVFVLLASCMIFIICFTSSARDLEAGTCLECSQLSKAPETRMAEFGCNLESMTQECKAWFEENPDTLKYAKDCSKNDGPSGENWLSACVDAGIENWTEILKLVSQSAKAIEACDNSIDCKMTLAKDAFFVCNNKDGSRQYPCTDVQQLQDVYAGDLMRKRDKVRTLALQDKDYREKILRAGVPLPEPGNGIDFSADVLKKVAEAQLSELGVKYSCYNSSGYAHMACYAIASVVDPTLILGAPGIAIKGGKWVKAIFRGGEKVGGSVRKVHLPSLKVNFVPGEAKQKLRDFLTAKHKAAGLNGGLQHFLIEKDGKTTLKIGMLRRNEKKFMALVTNAIRAGEISGIDAGHIVGPKVFSLMNRLKQEAIASGKEITITGYFDPGEIQASFKKQVKQSRRRKDGDAYKWTSEEKRDFQSSYKELGMDSCKGRTIINPVYNCRFTLTIQSGQANLTVEKNTLGEIFTKDDERP